MSKILDFFDSDSSSDIEQIPIRDYDSEESDSSYTEDYNSDCDIEYNEDQLECLNILSLTTVVQYEFNVNLIIIFPCEHTFLQCIEMLNNICPQATILYFIKAKPFLNISKKSIIYLNVNENICNLYDHDFGQICIINELLINNIRYFIRYHNFLSSDSQFTHESFLIQIYQKESLTPYMYFRKLDLFFLHLADVTMVAFDSLSNLVIIIIKPLHMKNYNVVEFKYKNLIEGNLVVCDNILNLDTFHAINSTRFLLYG